MTYDVILEHSHSPAHTKCRVVWFLVDFKGRMSGVALSMSFYADNNALFKLSKFAKKSTAQAFDFFNAWEVKKSKYEYHV